MNPNNKWKKYLKTIKKDWMLYLMLLPIVIFFLLWKYLPMTGLLAAFKYYTTAGESVLEADFRGFYYFKALLFGTSSKDFWRAFRNTFAISLQGLIFGFPIPIILALFFSEIKSPLYRSITQIISYLPKFISTVVITTMVALMLSSESQYNSAGIIATLLYKLGLASKSMNLMTEQSFFRPIYHISGIWQGAGYGSIVYFAAIMGISPTYYEAAKMDGANKLAQIRYVTLPGMAPTLTIMIILRIGDMLSVGYEKVLLLLGDSKTIMDNEAYYVGDVISTYVYRIGLEGGSYFTGSAADLFNSLIAMCLVLGANFISRRVSETSLF